MSIFQFKEFTIRQDRCAMKVGTDGVLLGAWADIEGAKRILDIGTGTGLIALMAAQRNPNATIDAVEIDNSASRQAEENIRESKWNNRIKVINTAIQDFHPDILYDVVICNPPFFLHSTPNPEAGKYIARHCVTLSHKELLYAAGRVLKADGTLQLILPVVEGSDFIKYATSEGWSLNIIAHIFPTPEKECKRYLMSFSRKNFNTLEENIIIEIKRDIYHQSFYRLVRDFYLFLE